MEFRILGPLEVLREGTPVPVRPGKQRILLASLLLRANRVVSSQELIDWLWHDGSVSRPRDTLYQHVMRLRQALGSPDVLRTAAGGYQLVVRPDLLDLQRFEDLVARAKLVAADGDLVAESNLLGEALSLWRGPALADVPSDSLRQLDGARLNELRLRVTERRLEIDVRLGRHAEVIGELTALTRQHPLRESLWHRLILALARSGRQAEALDAYQAIRLLLAEELGTDPGPELRDLHRAMLAGELEPLPATKGAAEHGRRITPSQLPTDTGDFVGRGRQVAALTTGLLPGTGSAVNVLAVSGKAGVGKTALAIHAAHRIRESFPDGQLYVDLHGTDHNPSHPAQVLGQFLRDLGAPDGALAGAVEQRAALYRSMLADRQILVVLDNAVDEAQVEPLLPGSPTCAVLVTSRPRLSGLAAQHIELDPLEPEQALELLGRITGADRVAAEPERAHDLTVLCGGLPLAVRIVATRLAAKPHWTLGDLAARLADQRHRLDELVHGTLDVRASLSASYTPLPSAVRRAFRRLGLAEADEFDAHAAAAMLNITAPDAELALERLVDARLLDVAGRDTRGRPRYRFPELIRVYAMERAAAEDIPHQRGTELSPDGRETLGGRASLQPAARR